MHLNKTRKLQKQTIDGSVSVTLPKPIVHLLGWKPGDVVDISIDTDRPEVVIRLAEQNDSL